MKPPKILKKLSDIFTGYKNLVFKSPEIEQMAEARLNVCLTCPARSDFKEHPENINLTSYCQLCSCVLEAKSRNPDSECPIHNWKLADKGLN